MNRTIAYCGLACDSCPIYLATLEQNKSRQQEQRETIRRMCNELYGMNLQLSDITDCDGCRSETDRLFSGCATCDIRKCAINRKLMICAFCGDYACENLQKHFKTDPSVRTRLEGIRSSKL